jgi:hypothetical protein
MFWLIAGLVLGAAIFWLATASKVKLTWYEWVLGVLGIILILFAIQNFGASQVALEAKAGNLLLLVFGLPGLILAVVAGVLAFLRGKKEAA